MEQVLSMPQNECWVNDKKQVLSFHYEKGCLFFRPDVKFCVSVFRQGQEWRWKAGRILA